MAGTVSHRSRSPAAAAAAEAASFPSLMADERVFYSQSKVAVAIAAAAAALWRPSFFRCKIFPFLNVQRVNTKRMAAVTYISVHVLLTLQAIQTAVKCAVRRRKSCIFRSRTVFIHLKTVSNILNIKH